MNREDWIWMAHPGHYRWADFCRFRLCTYVGNYIVSSVGEYLPNFTEDNLDKVNMIDSLIGLAKIRKEYSDDDSDIPGNSYEKLVGSSYLYETIVFKSLENTSECKCCIAICDDEEIEKNEYNTQELAFAGHYELCEKYCKL
jgi:hypothetical protein